MTFLALPSYIKKNLRNFLKIYKIITEILKNYIKNSKENFYLSVVLFISNISEIAIFSFN